MEPLCSVQRNGGCDSSITLENIHHTAQRVNEIQAFFRGPHAARKGLQVRDLVSAQALKLIQFFRRGDVGQDP